MLSGLEQVPVCVAYEVNGHRQDEMPMTQTEFHHAMPVYEYLDGWWEDISRAKDLADLPANARAYLAALEIDDRRAGQRGRRGTPPGPDPAAEVRRLRAGR